MAALPEGEGGAAPETGLGGILDAAATRLGNWHGHAVERCQTDLLYHWRTGENEVFQLFGSDLAIGITATHAWARLGRLLDGQLPAEMAASLERVDEFAARWRKTAQGRTGTPRALSSIDGAELQVPDLEVLVILIKSVIDVARAHWRKVREFPQNGDSAPPAPDGA